MSNVDNGDEVQDLSEDFSMNVDIRSIKVDKNGSLLSRVVLVLSLAGFFVPYIFSIAALVLVPYAKRQIVDSDGGLSGLKMIRWGKSLGWAAILIDTLGLIALILIVVAGRETLTELCVLKHGVPEYCPIVESLY